MKFEEVEKLDETLRARFYSLATELLAQATAVKSVGREPPKAEVEAISKLQEYSKQFFAQITELRELVHGSILQNERLDLNVNQYVRLYTDFKEEVKKKEKEIYDLKQLENLELKKAVELFNEQLAALEKFCADECNGLRVPWQLRYAAERSEASGGAVEFSGGVIHDASGVPIWEVRCSYCHQEIEHGAKGAGTLRYSCQECNRVYRCKECQAVSIDSILRSNAEKISPEILKVYQEFDPHFHHRMHEEFYHPVWLHIEVVKGATPAGMLQRAFTSYADRYCIGNRSKNGEAYEWITYKELGSRVHKFSAGLRHGLNIPQRAAVGICGNNCIEWAVSDFSLSFNQYVSVGIHTTYELEKLVFVINNAQMAAVISSEEMFPQICLASQQTNTLHYIIIMDDVSSARVEELTSQYKPKLGVKVLSMKQVMEMSTTPVPSLEELDQLPTENSCLEAPADLYTIMYTSGSTGNPKGVMITYPIFTYDISHALYISPLVTVSYIPLSHSTDRMRVYETLLNGGRVGFANYNARNWIEHESGLKKSSSQFLDSHGKTNGVMELLEDVKILKPTIFIAPPRIWNGIYEVYCQALSHYSKQGTFPTQEALESAVKDEILGYFGGRVLCIATGGAASSPKVVEFVKGLFTNISFDESYGATECGGITMNGKVMSDVQIKLVDLPEHGLTSADKPYPRGEIAVKSRTVATGYYRLPEETSESFHTDSGSQSSLAVTVGSCPGVNRWFYTGDLGQLDPETGALTILGRKKAIFTLSSGASYDPDYLESFYQESIPNVISQVCIVGDKAKDYVIAIVVLNSQFLEHQILEKKLDSKELFSSLNSNEQLKAEVLACISSTAKEKQLSEHKIPRAVILEAEEWTPSNGMLTTSFKVQRHQVVNRYSKLISAAF